MRHGSAPTSENSTAPTPPPRTATPRTDYRQVGSSGLYLPPISLGLWWNFGDNIPFDRQRALLRHAFDRGHHPLRPREQLRPAVRLGRDELRPR